MLLWLRLFRQTSRSSDLHYRSLRRRRTPTIRRLHPFIVTKLPRIVLGMLRFVFLCPKSAARKAATTACFRALSAASLPFCSATYAGPDRRSNPRSNARRSSARARVRNLRAWFGWTSNCTAICAIVRSPLIAAIATLALKAGEWFRLGRLLIVRS